MNIQKLLDDHTKLIHHLARLNIGRLKAVDIQIDLEELTAIFFEVFVVAAQKWDEDQSRFTTYLTTACSNKVTAILKKHFAGSGEANRVTYEHEMTLADDEEHETGIGVFGEDNADLNAIEVCQALSEELNNISPFARLLIEYTLCPPDFIERELEAQEAKHEFSLNMEGEAYRRKSLTISFVANCLMKTTDSSATRRFIRKAVNEAKSAVLRVAA